MALRIKLRPWKNRTKKIHINAKELSFLGVCGGRERDRGESNDKGREREKGGERERYIYDNHDITTPRSTHL